MKAPPMLRLALHSAWNRRVVLSLIVVCFMLSSFMLTTIERLRIDAHSSFANAVSGTDLIVGARSGSMQLLLYSVFRLGGATNNISWSSVQALKEHPSVEWLIPLSLGDTHRGYPVVATSDVYFQRFRYGQGRELEVSAGTTSLDVFESVIGSEVAKRLGYELGRQIVLSHGDGTFSENDHVDMPFIVSGILAPTGTPVDRSVHISLEGMEAIHHGWLDGLPLATKTLDPEKVRDIDLSPKAVTAVLVGLKSRTAVFSFQRFVSGFNNEPLMAILPGVTLSELWTVVGMGEKALRAMGALITLVSLAGLMAVSLAGLEQRRRELAILRALGLSATRITQLLIWEGFLVTCLGITLGYLAHMVFVVTVSSWAQSELGVALTLGGARLPELIAFGAILATGVLASLLPAVRAYQISLVDGLSPRE